MALKILYASSEVAPFAKTGGLADVGGALPRAIDALGHGHDVRVIMPHYGSIPRDRGEHLMDYPVQLGGWQEQATLRWTQLPGGVPLVFVDNDRFFEREGIYGTKQGEYADNGLRFGFFCRAVVEYIRKSGWYPDVVHINDWQTGLIPVFLRCLEYADPNLAQVATVHTIHNLAYQGHFGRALLGQLALPDALFDSQFLEFYERLSLMKAGVIFADKLTTVSPRYAQEIQTEEYGCSMEGILRDRSTDMVGILNGIDVDVWNPATEPHCWGIRYDARDLSPKEEIKRRLLEEFGMPYDEQVPLIGVISRLASQKGLDIIEEAAHSLAHMPVQMLFLGSGEPQYEGMLNQLSHIYPGRINAYIGFSEVLAHRIEAGSDLFLMPSRYEPCGLNQLISLKYGTIPIVRATGGLADSVVDVSDPHRGTGFVFGPYDSNSIIWSVNRALEMYHDPQAWWHLVQRAMHEDNSWRVSGQHYEEVYEWAAAERAGGRRGRFSSRP